MRHKRTAAVLGLGFLIGFVGPPRLQAEDRTDFTQLQTTLKQDDQLTVTTADGNKVEGRMMEISTERLVLRMKDGPRSIAASQIVKVKQRKNGVLLGALIGAGAGIPFAVVLAEYANNEGGSIAAFAAVPIAVGLGIGTAIDAALPSRKTLYDRNSKSRVTLAPVIDRKGFGARLAFKF